MSNEEAVQLQRASTPDYMKIRKYIVTLISNGTPDSAMLPPMVELAQQFGVTRMTVHKALKDLIRDKYLISRKGVGTFINPSRLREEGMNVGQRQIALVVGDGKHCFFDQFYWEHISAVGLEIVRRGHLVNLVNLLSVTPDGMEKELRNALVEGAVWIDALPSSTPLLQSLQEGGFPVVSLHQFTPAVNSIGMDCAAHATEVGRRLLAENRRNLVFAGLRGVPAVELQLQALRAVFKKQGLALHDRLVLRDPLSMEQDFRTILDFGVEPQALYVTGPHLQTLLPVLRERGVDIQRTCRVICEPFDPVVREEQFSGWVRDYRCDEEARQALDILERLLVRKDFRIESIRIPFCLRSVNLPDTPLRAADRKKT